MGLSMQKVPTGNWWKKPVPVSSQCLKSHMGEGINLGNIKHVNPWIPVTKLPYKVNFINIWVSNASADTCRPHPSQMEVTVSGILTPAGISTIHRESCRTAVLCPRAGLSHHTDRKISYNWYYSEGQHMILVLQWGTHPQDHCRWGLYIHPSEPMWLAWLQVCWTVLVDSIIGRKFDLNSWDHLQELIELFTWGYPRINDILQPR